MTVVRETVPIDQRSLKTIAMLRLASEILGLLLPERVYPGNFRPRSATLGKRPFPTPRLSPEIFGDSRSRLWGPPPNWLSLSGKLRRLSRKTSDALCSFQESSWTAAPASSLFLELLFP
ncbi:uncharacterized protein LOC144582859 [Callithrix jacchus]